jgi:hypothetical protein
MIPFAKTLATLILTFLVFSVSAQDYNLVKKDEVKGKTRGAEFLGMDDKGYVYTSSFRIRHFVVFYTFVPFIKVFDSKTGQIVTEKNINSLRQLKDKGYRYVDFVFLDKTPVVICKKKKSNKKGYYYFGFEVDHNMNVKSKPFKYSRYQQCSGFFQSSSSTLNKTYDHVAEDGTTTVVTNLTCNASKAKKQNLLLIRLNGTDYKELKRTKLNLAIPEINTISIASSTDKVYMSIQTQDRQKLEGKLLKRTILENHLFVVNEDGEVTEIELSLPNKEYRMGHFKLFMNEDDVVLNGQVLKNETNDFVGVFSARITPENDNIQHVDVKLFDVDFITQYLTERQKRRASNRAEKADGDVAAGDFYLMDYFKMDDGSAVNLFQKFREVLVTTTTTDSKGITTTKYTYYYYYEDIIAVKTTSSGDLDWVKLVPIRQVTTNFDPGMGYVATQKDGEIYIMHRASNTDTETINEGERQEGARLKDRMSNKVAITKIAENGDLSSEIVATEKEEKIFFLPNEVAVDEQNNQFIMLNSSRKIFSPKKTVVQTISL